MNIKTDAKTFFKQFAIFFGIITALVLLDFLFIKLSAKKWNETLSVSVQNVLDEKFPDEWKVSKNVKCNSPFATSSAIFEISGKNSAKKSYAIIIRTQTIFGTYPSVFICSKDEDIKFVGYTSVQGRVKNVLENDFNPRTLYWQKRAETVVKNSLQ